MGAVCADNFETGTLFLFVVVPQLSWLSQSNNERKENDLSLM